MWPTDDPVRDYDRHDAEREAALEKLPRCYNCGEPIQSEWMYDILGNLWCEECVENAKKLNREV